MSEKTKIENIKLKSNLQMGTILEEYCENVGVAPTLECKNFFREWNGRVLGKLIRQCFFASVFWATKHPEDIVIEGST